MTEVSRLSPELTRTVSSLARSLVAAARSWALYPPEHPSLVAAVDRFRSSLNGVTAAGGLTIGVTPEALIVEGVPAAPQDRQIAEAAALLHDRDILHLTFAGEVPAETAKSLLSLLALDAASLRARGGPALVWNELGHRGIVIEQIDYKKVLEDREGKSEAARRDDIWKSIVRAVIERHKALDEAAQQRLLEIAGDVNAIEELAGEVMAPNCTPDGCPMLATQAATVLVAYRHLMSIVSVMEPDRVDEVVQNLAAATSRLDARVVMQMLRGEGDEPAGVGGVSVSRRIADAFDDMKVAQLLATALAIDGQASERLADVFNTIAPDAERKRRVLTLTKSLLGESDFGKQEQFKALWQSMEELLISYNEKPFVSTDYRAALDGVGGRADTMAQADLPPELPEWLETLGQDNVRALSVTLLTDLFRLEKDSARLAELAADLGALAEDLLMAVDFRGAADVTKTLAEVAGQSTHPARDACRKALDEAAASTTLREAAAALADVGEREAALFQTVCRHIGPACIDALQVMLFAEARSAARDRVCDLIVSFGTPAVRRLAPLAGHEKWHVQHIAADLLGRIGVPEAVALLQPLLRSADGRVAQAAVRALAGINDPAAARAVHTMLRSVAGDSRRAVVSALVADRDPRIVPVLVRILNESEPFGKDHGVVLETLAAIGELKDDRAVQTVESLMQRRKFFARKKAAALKAASVAALVKIGSEPARAAIQRAAQQGDRLLRRVAQQAVR